MKGDRLDSSFSPIPHPKHLWFLSPLTTATLVQGSTSCLWGDNISHLLPPLQSCCLFFPGQPKSFFLSAQHLPLTFPDLEQNPKSQWCLWGPGWSALPLVVTSPQLLWSLCSSFVCTCCAYSWECPSFRSSHCLLLRFITSLLKHFFKEDLLILSPSLFFSLEHFPLPDIIYYVLANVFLSLPPSNVLCSQWTPRTGPGMWVTLNKYLFSEWMNYCVWNGVSLYFHVLSYTLINSTIS